MDTEGIYSTNWGRNQLELKGQMRNWIRSAIGRQSRFQWRGGHDEGSYTCSWGNYYKLTGEEYVKEFLWWLRDSYLAWSEENYYHGFQEGPGDHANHAFENAEEFITALYDMDPSDEVSADIIEDIAHHVGNWVEGIPDWYDWDKHRFVSHWLGTKVVKDYPPYDFELAGHTRIGLIVIYAYNITKNPRYLEWCQDYADKWAGIIEESEGRIPMVTYPRELSPEERMETYNFGRERVGDPYVGNLWAPITAHAVRFLLRVYKLTGESRYTKAARKAIGMYEGIMEEIRLIGIYLEYQEMTGDNIYQDKLEKWYKKNILPSLEAEHMIPNCMLLTRRDGRSFAFKDGSENIIHYTGPTPDMYLKGYKITGNLECLNRAMTIASAELDLVLYSTRDGREHGCASHRYIHGIGEEAADILYKITGIDKVNYFNGDGSLGLPDEVAVACDLFDEKNPILYFYNDSANSQLVKLVFKNPDLKIKKVKNGEILKDKSDKETIKVKIEPKEILEVGVECF